MKKRPLLQYALAIVSFAIVVIVTLGGLLHRLRPHQASQATVGLGATSGAVRPVVGPTAQSTFSEIDSIARLERLGHVPDGAKPRDWYLAQHTSWWGRRLDPTAFWSGRVLWCDKSAMAAANAHGRTFPPIPYNAPRFGAISDEDARPSPAGSEDYGATSLYSERERAFWDDFNRTHPMPPERIESNQRSVAQDANSFARKPGTIPGLDWAQLARRARGLALQQGCPPEALSDEALRWAFILQQRELYREALAAPPPVRAARINLVLGRVAVDQRLITDVLTDEQVRAASSWKIAYLQRLRRERIDESYMNAYLEAWNLSATEVFGQ